MADAGHPTSAVAHMAHGSHTPTPSEKRPNGGQVVLTDRIFPSPGSDGVAAFATGGTARLVSLETWAIEVPGL